MKRKLKPPGGRYLAQTLVDPHSLTASALSALHEDQRTVDPETGEPHTGVNVGAMTTALRESSRRALAPDAGTTEVEQHLWASAQLLQNLMVAWSVAAARADWG